MTEKILCVFGILAFLDALFNKWNTYDSIEVFLVNLSERTKIKLIFNLAFCMFCQRFWMTVIITLLFGFFSEFTFDMIFVPLICSGIFNLIKNPV